MKSKWKLAVLISVLGIIVVHTYLDFAGYICTLGEVDAKNSIYEEELRRGFDQKNLSAIEYNWPNQCSYSATYKSDQEHISYVVSQDLLHGVKLHMWDFNSDE